MNRIFLSIIVIGLCTFSYGQEVSALKGIQECYAEALNKSFMSQANEVGLIIEKLKSTEQKADHKMFPYWIAYGHYYEAIYFMKTEQNKEGMATLKEAIKLLEDKGELNAEEHVMVGSLMSLMMAFSPGSVITLSSKSVKHFQKAVKLDPQNLRAYLSLGRSDFYKPKAFGGGKKVEEYLFESSFFGRSGIGGSLYA